MVANSNLYKLVEVPPYTAIVDGRVVQRTKGWKMVLRNKGAGSMKFDYDGLSYVIEFERKYNRVIVDGVWVNDEYKTVKDNSRYPNTVARLIQLPQVIPDVIPGERVVFRTVTVGCWHREKQFSLEKGRIHALRLISATIPREMRRAMWRAYNGRRNA